jgi:hypothetical protein
MVASPSMSPIPHRPRSRASIVGRGSLFVVLLIGLAGCGVTTSPPPPTPADFQGIAGELVRRGLQIDHIVSGDAGCDDIGLARTAIALDASGLDQTAPIRVYFYIFRNRASFDRLRQTVDGCARSYATDPETFESIEASPFVVASAGPWAPEFRAAVRAAITEAAGTGD